jgi:hypothetical protein
LFKLDKDKEIKRLKEEYMILQNASDEVEEEKDKEIERLNNIIIELEKWLNDLTILKTDKFGEARFYDMVKIQAVLNKLLELKGSGKE